MISFSDGWGGGGYCVLHLCTIKGILPTVFKDATLKSEKGIILFSFEITAEKIQGFFLFLD